PGHETREPRKKSGAVPADQCGQADGASRCAGVPGWGDRVAHPAVQRPARDCATVAGFSAPCGRSGGTKARFACQVIGLLSIKLEAEPSGWRSLSYQSCANSLNPTERSARVARPLLSVIQHTETGLPQSLRTGQE